MFILLDFVVVNVFRLSVQMHEEKNSYHVIESFTFTMNACKHHKQNIKTCCTLQERDFTPFGKTTLFFNLKMYQVVFLHTSRNKF